MKSILTWILLGSLVTMAWFSQRLAGVRIYHPDECQNVFMAGVIAANQVKSFHAEVGLFQWGVLSWMARHATRSVDTFVSARSVMLEVFWLNLLLIALATGERLLSRRGLVALVGAATLVPLWDYGFEVRPDNLLLSGILLTWCIVRGRPTALPSFLLIGALTVALEFIAFKALLYMLPLSVAVLAFTRPGRPPLRWGASGDCPDVAAGILPAVEGGILPPGSAVETMSTAIPPGKMPGSTAGRMPAATTQSAGTVHIHPPRWKLILSWATGVLCMLLLMRWVYGHAGLWDVYLADFRWALGQAIGWNILEHCKILARLLSQVPLVMAVLAAALVSLVVEVQGRGKAALSWEGSFPEAILFLGSLGILLVNPVPRPSDLLLLVPFAFVYAFRYAAMHWHEIWGCLVLRPVVVTVLVFTHLVPFVTASRQYWDIPNSHQEARMRLAEEFTDPAKDPVYDGIGLVPSRPSIHYWWLLPDSNHPSFAEARGLRVRDLLAARPAAVVIPSFRTDFLPEEDQAFLRERYVPLADDFWVLGNVLPPGGGAFEIIHPGRYRISTLEGSDLAGTYPEGLAGLMAPVDPGTLVGTLDGLPLSKQTMLLTTGTHRIQAAPGCVPTVVWMGPQRERASRLGQGDHTLLFTNRY